MPQILANHDGTCAYRARYVLPISRPPLENATIVLEDEQIVELHQRRDPDAVDLGNVAILPALINAHTHLEFSDLRQPLPPDGPFTNWITRLVAHRRSRTRSGQDLVRAGLREAAEAGTGVLAEIATDDLPAAVYVSETTDVECAVFREAIGLAHVSIAEQLNIARNHLDRPLPEHSAGHQPERRVPRGLSPHAPYSVHPELFAKLITLASKRRVPVAMHLAETRAELELLSHGTGPFVGMLQQFGVWNPDAFQSEMRILDFLRGLAKAPRGLVVHGNYLTPEDIEFLGETPHLTVVYCPRTHAAFGHEPHPWRVLLRHGVRVAIGTDSRASNPDLSLWNELRFLWTQRRDVAPMRLLQMATLSGAEALGIQDRYGSLEPGKTARLTVCPLPESFPNVYTGLLRGPVETR